MPHRRQASREARLDLLEAEPTQCHVFLDEPVNAFSCLSLSQGAHNPNSRSVKFVVVRERATAQQRQFSSCEILLRTTCRGIPCRRMLRGPWEVVHRLTTDSDAEPFDTFHRKKDASGSCNSEPTSELHPSEAVVARRTQKATVFSCPALRFLLFCRPKFSASFMSLF